MEILRIMKNLILFTALILSLISTTFLTAQGTYNPSQIIIDFADGVTSAEIDEYLDLIGGTIVDQIDNDIYLVEIASFPIQYTDVNGQEVVFYNVVEIIENENSSADIDDTNLNYNISSTPLNFLEIAESLPYGIYTPIPGTVDEYPGLLSCPNIPQSKKIKVAIIDTGIDHDHTFITEYVVYEANVYNNEPFAIDDNGHGTSVAGIIAGLAQASNISPDNLELYIIKALDTNGNGSLFDMVKAVEIARSLDVDILNLSWGFSYQLITQITPSGESGPYIDPSTTLKNAISRFQGVAVCGAGNDGVELPNSPTVDGRYGPADFIYHDLSKLITVGALNIDNNLAVFSNFNNQVVDVYAPGVELLTPTLNGNWISNNSGTSFSSAIVTASIALKLIGNQTEEIDDNENTEEIIIAHSNLIEENRSPVSSISIDHTIQNFNGDYFIGKIIDISGLCSNSNNFSFYQSEIINSSRVFNIRKNLNQGFDFNFSPNPAVNYLELTLLNLKKGELHFRFFDNSGKLIYSGQRVINNDYYFKSISIELSGGNFPSGIYRFQLSQGNEVVNKSLFIN